MYTYRIEMVNHDDMSDQKGVTITRDKWCSTPLHTHEFIEIVYIIAGNGIQQINGKDHFVKRGDVTYMKIGDSHKFCSNNGMQVLNCIFMPNAFPHHIGNENTNADSLDAIPNLIHLPSNSILEVENLLLKIERENEERQFAYQSLLKNYASILVTLLFRYARSESNASTNAFVSSILDYLEENFAKSSLVLVSKHFNFSPSYFSKLFKKNVGMSFSKYITDRRMRAAIRLITNTNNTVASILKDVGFTEPKQFYKVFREYTGTSPGKYRKAYQNAISTNDSEPPVFSAVGYEN